MGGPLHAAAQTDLLRVGQRQLLQQVLQVGGVRLQRLHLQERVSQERPARACESRLCVAVRVRRVQVHEPNGVGLPVHGATGKLHVQAPLQVRVVADAKRRVLEQRANLRGS